MGVGHKNKRKVHDSISSAWRSPPVYRGRGPRSGEGVQIQITSLIIFCQQISQILRFPADCLLVSTYHKNHEEFSV